MKKVLFFIFLLAGYLARGQQIVQPLSSGDYWEINDYQQRLPELANDRTFPRIISFPNGSVGVSNLWPNRIIGANEIYWKMAGVQNVTDFYVEYSRDMQHFERAGIVHLLQAENGTDFIFRHQFNDRNLVYYRLAFVRNGQIMAYTPAVQLAEEENRTKIFPTVVQGSTFYVQTAFPYEMLQVVNGASQTVFEKPLDGRTGTVTIGLPSLPRGIYFVRLLSRFEPQHVQRILIE